MPLIVAILVVSLASWLLIAFSLRSLARKMKTRAETAMTRLLGGAATLLFADGNLLRAEPPEAAPRALHGLGVLALTRDRLAFLPWHAREPFSIPLPRITDVRVMEPGPGMRLPAPALAVSFADESGRHRTFLWLVVEPERWKDEMEGKSRGNPETFST